MKTFPDMSASRRAGDSRLLGLLRFLPPFPVFIIQPLLNHVVSSVAHRRPELFDRLGDNCQKRYLIDPTNLPFFLLLQPNPQRPKLTAFRRDRKIDHDVIISATFRTLLMMIDSQVDSDALFFTRDLKITGDTEAIVALRNALDDMDGTLAGDVIASFGPLSGPIRAAFKLTESPKGLNS